jgi:hypothetical protein
MKMYSILLAFFVISSPSSAQPSAKEVLDGLQSFTKRTALPDGSFRPGIDPDYRGMSDSAYSNFAPVTYAVVLHRTFGWTLPHEDQTRAWILARQQADGAFTHTAGTVDPQSAQGRVYNTTMALMALHGLGTKPRHDPLPVFAKVMEKDYKNLPAYSSSFFPLAYRLAGAKLPEGADQAMRGTLVQAEDGYLNDHVAATFHAVHYDKLLGVKTPKADLILKRTLADQKADGSWTLNPLARDRHACFDAVFMLKHLGAGRADCKKAMDRAADWALSSRNGDGGFGHYPGSPSDWDACYFQVGVLVMAGRLQPAATLPKDAQLLGWGHLFAEAKQAAPTVAAVVETTLKTAPGQIRQFAFDGKPDTYFASANNPGKSDHFTLVFDVPVALKSVTVTTGKPKGGDALESGILEVSTDGQKFAELAKFTNGVAGAKPGEQKVKAIRVKPTSNLQHPLVIREFVVDSEPRVAVFKYPVEFIVDVSDAPEMQEWADKVARICERNYTMINDELPSAGFKPRTVVYMTLKNRDKGVAEAGGGRITGTVKYFKTHPDDIGAMIHETVHIVQAYRTGGPGWLVEGIADYVRFFKYEPGKIGKIAKDPHYNGSYRTSAAFLNFVSTQYDKELVRKVNKALREGEYRETIWTTLTKKTLKELDEDWRASMKKGPAKFEAGSLRQFRRLDELDRHLLDQDDFLGGDMLLLQQPLELAHASD